MEEDSRHSGITDDENFAELPPVQVMNNASKPQSPKKASLEDQEQLEREEKMKQEIQVEEERLRQEMEV
jgi:hypothetical protein